MRRISASSARSRSIPRVAVSATSRTWPSSTRSVAVASPVSSTVVAEPVDVRADGVEPLTARAELGAQRGGALIDGGEPLVETVGRGARGGGVARGRP